jgi:LPS export ABC transporter protein LptC
VRQFFSVMLCALLCAGCEEKVRPAVAPGATTDIPSQESWNSTVTFTDSAHVRAVLWSGHISVYTPRQYTLLDESVRVDFYNEFEQHTSVLTAQRGKVNDQTRDFEAYDSVVVVSDSGTVLKTDRLFWTNATRLIHTDAYVEISSATEHIRGHGMESDQSLKNYRIFRVTGRAVTRE